MITDVEMEAMGMLVSEFLNKEGFEREHYALGAMNDMLADLDSDWFYVASDTEKKVFVKQFADAIIGERERTAVETEQIRWICVYKDTVCRHNDVDNLVNIAVPESWLFKALRAEGETDIEAWFDEYTADSTDSIARKALVDGVILGCDDEYVMSVIDFQNKHPDLVLAAQSVCDWLEGFGLDVPDNIGFEYQGARISNPFYDETWCFEVEPFSYYGENNMRAYLEQAKELMAKESARGGKDLDAVIRSCEEVSKKTNNEPDPKDKDRGLDK